MMLIKKIGIKKPFVFLFFLLTAGIHGQQPEVQNETPVSNSMVYINGGTFLMGSPANEQGRSNNEGPQHRVTVSSFYIGRYPVTQAQYQELMGTSPSGFNGLNLPVERVSWLDAVEYCNKLSLKEGLAPVYSINGNSVSQNLNANGYRLPTEAEWEYACRAGTETPYYSGVSVDDAGWHSGNSNSRTHPVGEKQPNPWGLYDMHGNVLEWCWDWLGDYSRDEQTNPQGSVSGSDRVYRGGCWQFASSLARSAYRFGNKSNLRINFVGFRLARSIGI